ncbi:MAG: AraC-like ligand binding domain, partial [Capsulimonas sp.]|nr:AraC-like ligand binding domain [Capsulimonas sp.]
MKREHIARQWLENNGPIYAGCERVQEGYRMLRASDADDWQILATMGGQGIFYAGDNSLHVSPGSIVLIPPGVRQEYGPKET